MRTYNIREARIQLSKLVEPTAKGEPFVISKGGKPLVKVVAMKAPESGQMKRFGFPAGQIQVRDDFITMGRMTFAECFR